MLRIPADVAIRDAISRMDSRNAAICRWFSLGNAGFLLSIPYGTNNNVIFPRIFLQNPSGADAARRTPESGMAPQGEGRNASHEMSPPMFWLVVQCILAIAPDDQEEVFELRSLKRLRYNAQALTDIRQQERP
jgi:hypothetical protein